jgi:hypothetical protein
MSAKWIVKQRDYELENVKYQMKLNEVNRDQDPLSVAEIKMPVKKTIKKGNTIMKRAAYNPLEGGLPGAGGKNSTTPTSSQTMQTFTSNTNTNTQSNTNTQKQPLYQIPKQINVDELKFISFSLIVNKNFNVNDSIDINWASIRKNLMDLFCNNFNMEVKSLYSFSLDEEDLQKNYKIEAGRTRLEELEAEGKKNKFNVVSSGEYVARMEVLKKEMMQKWEQEDKVGTLKIIIHCTKMLNDVFTPRFYTHKFLIISDILDVFSKLVYERIYKLSFPGKNVEFDDIQPTIVNTTARDICSNWIYKCSCIRELLPRIYIDIIFLKIFKFIYTEKEIELKIINIAKMTRGISHPLISYYVGMYLAKVALSLYPKYKSFLLVLVDNSSKFNLTEELVKKLGYENMSSEDMKKILEPCVEWVIYCLGKNMTESQFNNFMKIYDQNKNFFIIKNLLIHAPIKFIFSGKYLEYIFACVDLYDNTEGINLYMIICHRILNTNNSLETKYMQMMWEKVKKLKNKTIFIDCCVLIGEILIKFHAEDFQDKFFEEVFEIFKTNINTTSNSNTEDANYYHKFEIFLYSILTKINNYSNILNADNFLYLLENFNEQIKLNICHTILTQIINSGEKIADPYLAFSLLKIGKYIHDSIDISSPESKKKEISEILINFIRKVDFGLDYENLLNFLTEARGNYSDLDEVIELLVQEVQRVCMQTCRVVKGKHNKKTLRFCKVCVAYMQITIPSLKSFFTQLKLLQTSAQIALSNNLISEADSLVKNFITILAKLVNEDGKRLDKVDLENLFNLLNNLMSFLVVVPSNPESPYQLVNGLINVFNMEEENEEGERTMPNTSIDIRVQKTKIKLHTYLSIVKYLITQQQIKLPYHIQNIDSNDEIFPKDELFRNEGLELIRSLIDSILSEISSFDSNLSSFDYEEYEFLLILCLNCAETFNCLFQETKYSNSVINKLLELSKNYLENLKKNKTFNKEKLNNYVNHLTRLTSS